MIRMVRYRPAPKELVLTEANKLSGYQLRRGAKILSAETAKSVIGYKLRGKQQEVFACLFLDSQHRILAFKEMFIGSINHTTVHPREIVKEALQLNATAVILAHNHPSGGSEPSQQDIISHHYPEEYSEGHRCPGFGSPGGW